MSPESDPARSEPEVPVVRILSLAAGGDGVGRLADGCVVFVEGSAPGDLVEIEGLVRKKRLARARVARVLEASDRRTSPRCEHFGRCGGCCWQHVGYDAQLEAKRRIASDALERIAGIELEGELEIVASPRPYGYRARARLVEGPCGLGYRRRGTHEIESIRECPILVPAAEERLRESVRADAAAQRDAPSDSDAAGTRRRSRAREWTLLAGSKGGAELVATGSGSSSSEGVWIELLGESLRVGPESFLQGNAWLWEPLARAVLEAAVSGARGADPAKHALVELYAGIGFFTLPLARAGFRGMALESDRSALDDLAVNLARAGLEDRIEVVPGRIERRRDLARRLGSAGLLVLDPPRTGLDARVRRAIGTSGPERVVYVSCDPATLARDLRELLATGYRMTSARAFDLFPQTAHVEVVATLERPS